MAELLNIPRIDPSIAKELHLCQTYVSSPNIAWVKYWGKYDEQNIFPWNDNIGLTLNSKDIYTKTTITFGNLTGKQEQIQNQSWSQKDSLILNNQPHAISKRIERILKRVKKTVRERKYNYIQETEWEKYKFRIQSVNSFPTASGLASSASGLACLVAALNGLFDGVFQKDEVAELARRGSGSASRSIYGGLVQWHGIPQEYTKLKRQQLNEKQVQELNRICLAQTVLPADKLDFIDVIILLANQKQKEVPSTSGMQRSMQTSSLIQYRNKIAYSRCQHIKKYLASYLLSGSCPQTQYSLFSNISQIIIKDSNQFHAICLDTYPPIHYLTQFSHLIMHIVDNIINENIQAKVGYTFDAGPHAFLFVHREMTEGVLRFLKVALGIEQEIINQRAREIMGKGNENSQWVKKCLIMIKEKEIIKPVAMWASSVGHGAQRIQKGQN